MIQGSKGHSATITLSTRLILFSFICPEVVFNHSSLASFYRQRKQVGIFRRCFILLKESQDKIALGRNRRLSTDYRANSGFVSHFLSPTKKPGLHCDRKTPKYWWHLLPELKRVLGANYVTERL